MNAPFHPLGFMSDTAALLSALPLGMAFGAFLERSGFANPRNVIGQFLGTDLRVLKMMFTALVTTMIGILALDHLALIDTSLLFIPPTHLSAQLIGGALLGLGLITAGYCPGTSIVGAATGRIDAWTCLAGLSLGVILFAVLDPVLSGILGHAVATRSTLPQLLGVPTGWIVLAVTILATGAFLLAEWVEIRLGGKQPDAQPLLSGSPHQGSRWIIGGLVLFAAFLAGMGDPSRAANSTPTLKPMGPTTPPAAIPTPRRMPSGC